MVSLACHAARLTCSLRGLHPSPHPQVDIIFYLFAGPGGDKLNVTYMYEVLNRFALLFLFLFGAH